MGKRRRVEKAHNKRAFLFGWRLFWASDSSLSVPRLNGWTKSSLVMVKSGNMAFELYFEYLFADRKAYLC
jgi:hypothetical protein